MKRFVEVTATAMSTSPVKNVIGLKNCYRLDRKKYN